MATSYEEIYRRIAEGRPADCEAAVEAELTLLVTFGGRVPVMIAVAIAEAQSFHKGDRDWLASAKDRWNFPGDKTIFHYVAVGRMLLSLRDYSGRTSASAGAACSASGGVARECLAGLPGREDGIAHCTKEARALEQAAHRCYLKLVTLEFGKLLKLTVLAHDRRRGVVEIINFMRLHYDPAMTNQEFARKIDELYGYGRRQENTEQLSFHFDMLDDVNPETVADLMESPEFGAAEALQVVSNGALWCRSAAAVVAAHAGDFSDAAVPEFERLAAELAEAKSKLDELIAASRRRRLGSR